MWKHIAWAGPALAILAKGMLTLNDKSRGWDLLVRDSCVKLEFASTNEAERPKTTRFFSIGCRSVKTWQVEYLKFQILNRGRISASLRKLCGHNWTFINWIAPVKFEPGKNRKYTKMRETCQAYFWKRILSQRNTQRNAHRVLFRFSFGPFRDISNAR